MEATLTRPPTHMLCVNVLKGLTHVMIRDDHAVCVRTHKHTHRKQWYTVNIAIYTIYKLQHYLYPVQVLYICTRTYLQIIHNTYSVNSTYVHTWLLMFKTSCGIHWQNQGLLIWRAQTLCTRDAGPDQGRSLSSLVQWSPPTLHQSTPN